MSYEFAKKEIGDYRITIYQDEDAECPCTEWDLVGVYFWDYSSITKSLKRYVRILQSTSTPKKRG